MNTKANKLHATIAAMFAAFQATTKSDRADYDATMKLLRTAPLNDAECVKAIRDDLFATFTEAHKDAAQMRVNIVNNARRVAFGGTKDGKAIRGRGMATLLDICAGVASIRDLKAALAENVPEALKGKSGSKKNEDRKTKGTGKSDRNAISLPKIADREGAFAAARKVLEFCRDKFVKPSETGITERINATLEVLK